MPQNDLGTAHGSIRIDFDDRGSAKAEAALAKMQAQFELMNKKLSSIEKALTTTEKALKDTSGSFDKASAASKGFGGSLLSTSRNATNFIKDVKELKSNLDRLAATFVVARTAASRFGLGFRTLDLYKRNMQANSLATRGFARDLVTANGHVTAFASAMSKAGIFSTIFNKQLLMNTLGVKAAMKTMPAYTQNIYTLASGLSRAALVAKAFDKAFSGDGIAAAMKKVGNVGPIKRLLDANEDLRKSFEKTTNAMARAPNNIKGFAGPIQDFARSTQRFTAGVALVRRGVQEIADRFAWLSRIPSPIKSAFFVGIADVLPAALKVFGKALIDVSNLAAGLWDGIKQLGGGIAILPGLFATIGAAVTPLAIAFAGLKKNLKDAFSSDPGKAAEAYYSLPPAIAKVVDSVKSLQPAFKAMQDSFDNILVAGLSQQIEQLGNTYLPLLQKSGAGVVESFRHMKDAVVDFLNEAQTQKDVGKIYSGTAITMEELSRAIQPALDGLRSMSVVGNQFISEFGAQLPALAQKWERFSIASTNSGKAMDWMYRAESGVIDLTRGSESLVKALYSILTMFQTQPETNWLNTYANSMEKFQKAVQKSAATGGLHEIADAVRGMANTKLDGFRDVWDTIKLAMRAVVPIVQSISQAFSGPFVFAIKEAATEVRFFASIFHNLGLDTVIGSIYGVIKGWQAFSLFAVPVLVKLRLLVGAFLALREATNVVATLQAAAAALAMKLEVFGPVGVKASASLVRVAEASGGVLTALVSALPIIGVVALAIGALALAYFHGSDEIKAFNAQLDENKASLQKFRGSLTQAFQDDGGIAGKSVMTAISKGVDDMLNHLDDTAKKGPGIASHLKNLFIDTPAHLFDPNRPKKELGAIDSDQINKAQQMSGDAGHAATQIRELQNAGDDLTKTLAGSDGDFAAYIEHLHAINKNDAAASLQQLRDQIKGSTDDAKLLGPAGEEAAKGFNELAQAGNNAADKLEGLRHVLEGLGVLKVSSVEAIAEYKDSIAQLSDKVAQAIQDGDGLDNVWDRQNNTLNTNSQTGRNLIKVFGDLSNSFLTAATNGGNVDDLMKTINDQLDSLSQQTGIAKQDLQNFFATSLGVNPVVKILVQLPGKDAVTQEFGNLLAHLQVMAQTGAPMVPLQFDTPQAAQGMKEAMQKYLGGGIANDFDAVGTNLVLKPGVQISPDDMAKLNAFLNSHGISTQATPAPPAVIAPNAAPPGAPAAAAAPGRPGATPSSNPAQDQAVAQSQELIDAVNSILETGGEDAGKKFVDALATGIGKANAADKAANDLANSLIENFHQSPPKKGPLAAHGDAAKFAGAQFVQAYSTGMRGSALSAIDAAQALGGGLLSGMKAGGKGGVAGGGGQGAEDTGKMFGDLKRMSDFLEHVVNAFNMSFTALTGFLKWASDPMKKGTFFGQAKGAAFGYTAALNPEAARKKYLDDVQKKAFATAGTGAIDPNSFDPATGMPKITTPGALQRGAKGDDVKRAIVAQGQAAGASKEDILAALGVAQQESGFDAGAVGKGKGSGGSDAIGVFQQSLGSWGTLEQLTDPNQNIANYWEHWKNAKGATPEERALAIQGPAGAAQGGYDTSTIRSHMAEQAKPLEEILKTGAMPTQAGSVPGIGAFPGLTGVTPILHDTDNRHTQPGVANVATIIAGLFPQLKEIGGARNDDKQWHPAGRGLDVMLPGGSQPESTTPQDMQLGNMIADFVAKNAKQLGIEGYIWQDVYHSATGQLGATPQPGHKNHVHIQWKDGATFDIGPNGSNLQLPVGTPGALSQNAFGAPAIPGQPHQQGVPNKFMRDPATGQMVPVSSELSGGPIPKDLAPTSKLTDKGLEVYDASGNLIQTFDRNLQTEQPVKDAAGREIGRVVPGAKPNEPATLAPAQDWNPTTGAPYTDQERSQWIKDHPLQYTPGPDVTQRDLSTMTDPTSGVYFGTQQAMEDAMKAASPTLAEDIATAYGPSQSAAAAALQRLAGTSQTFKDSNTAEGRAQASIIDQNISAASEQQGLQQAPDPIDALGGAASSISGAVQSIFSTINSAIESVGAAKDLADYGVRGVANTQDVMKEIDDVQKFIELAANIAGTVANVSSAIGSIVSAAGNANPMGGDGGASAAIQGVSAIASGVQATLQTINAVIDLAQEAYNIWGSYYGQFLGMLTGGPGGELMGNVKYLLDTRSGQLINYSADNPGDKRYHTMMGQQAQPDVRNQLAGNIIVYGGPGSDPRDDTRQMLFQVRQAQATMATSG